MCLIRCVPACCLPLPPLRPPPPLSFLLQENRVVRLIRRQLVKRSLDMLSEIAGREDKKVGWVASSHV